MSRAYSLVEMLVVLTIVVVACGAGMPALLAARDDARADGAVDFLVAELRQARMEALRRNAQVAIRFESVGADVLLALYVDGNGNGVRSADIAAGVDRLLRPRGSLGEHFPGARFGIDGAAVDLDGVPSGENSNPVRFGTSRMASFSPTGTSTSGSAYVVGRGRRQLALRVLGGTGRVRSFLYNFGTATWSSR